MNIKSKISIVMATYNGVKFLEAQLDTIRNQTCKVHEVIICDDASSDGTPEFVEDYIEKYSLKTWKLIKNETNLGWIKNFYKLFENVTGDIIFCADQDDLWMHDKVFLMSAVFERNPNVLVLGGTVQYVTENNTDKTKLIEHKTKKGSNGLYKIPFNSKFYLTHRPGCATCFRRSLLPYINEMKNDYYPHDKLIWNIGILLEGAYLYNKVVIRQRRHNQSAMMLKKKESKRLKELVRDQKILMKCKAFFLEKKLNNRRKLILIEKGYTFFDYRVEFLKSGDMKIGFKLLKYLNYYPRFRSYFADLNSAIFKKRKNG